MLNHNTYKAPQSMTGLRDLENALIAYADSNRGSIKVEVDDLVQLIVDAHTAQISERGIALAKQHLRRLGRDDLLAALDAPKAT